MYRGASQASEELAFRPLKLDWRFKLLLIRISGNSSSCRAKKRRHCGNGPMQPIAELHRPNAIAFPGKAVIFSDGLACAVRRPGKFCGLYVVASGCDSSEGARHCDLHFTSSFSEFSLLYCSIQGRNGSLYLAVALENSSCHHSHQGRRRRELHARLLKHPAFNFRMPHPE
jgi:hypothetical protein